jgi:hypothetical protein
MGEPDVSDSAEEPAAPAPADAPARPSLEEVVSWAGHRLDDIGGGAVGKVEGTYVDAESGRPEWLLSRMGRFGHYCLVPARDAVGGVDRVWIPYTRDQIRQAPKIEPKAELTRAREDELLAHYGIGGEAGRAADIASRDAKAVTARPA